MRRLFSLSLMLSLILAMLPMSRQLAAQGEMPAPVEELAVNEAAGRVVIVVVNGGILIGTLENPIEAGTRPPVPSLINTDRAGIILGAVQWTSPSSQKDLARLDIELPHLRDANVSAGETPHLGAAAAQSGQEASDIEAIGKPLRDRIAAVAGAIHNKLDWPANEPVVELVLADYLPDYGPEVWQVSYGIEQEQQHGDFWVTNIGHPVYEQAWPPEKGQPHTLMEFNYPPENAAPSILDLLRQRNPKLDALAHSDSKMSEVANRILQGDTRKIPLADATQFLRAALDAVKPPNARETISVIREITGFEWILQPPSEPKATTGAQADRPAGAPTLIHPSSAAPGPGHPPNSR